MGLFGCVLDFLSEIRPWICPSVGESATKESGQASAMAPSIVDLWAMQRLGLECSRVLGVWVAEDPESLPQRFLEALPVLLALKAGDEVSVYQGKEGKDDPGVLFVGASDLDYRSCGDWIGLVLSFLAQRQHVLNGLYVERWMAFLSQFRCIVMCTAILVLKWPLSFE